MKISEKYEVTSEKLGRKNFRDSTRVFGNAQKGFEEILETLKLWRNEEDSFKNL